MTEVVNRFATSAERRTILEGLLDYREQLNAIGFVNGYQWLDGSFVEDIEANENRPPNDVDVVTVAYRPANHAANFQAFVHANIQLFHVPHLKQTFKVDGYFIDLEKRADLLVEDVSYWYGLFSHSRKKSLWKGMLRVPFDANDDALARVFL